MSDYSTVEDFEQPTTKFNKETKLYRLEQDYYFEWGPEGFRKRVFITKGKEYDKASTPFDLCNDEEWDGPSLVHDMFYREKGKFRHLKEFRFEVQLQDGNWKVDPTQWKRKEVDGLFKLMGKAAGAPYVQVFYMAVRWWPGNIFTSF